MDPSTGKGGNCASFSSGPRSQLCLSTTGQRAALGHGRCSMERMKRKPRRNGRSSAWRTPREYPEEQKAFTQTVDRLNRILALEGFRLERDHGHPQLIECDPEIPPDASVPNVELKVSMTDVLDDPALTAVAQQRLDEARVCHANKAYMATIIMLGSLLEGILVGTAAQRLKERPPKPLDQMGLQELVNLAHREGWIEIDVHKGSELIRYYRNLVHPRAQLRMKHSPNADTVDMCWPIVNATLNDLAATRPPKTVTGRVR